MRTSELWESNPGAIRSALLIRFSIYSITNLPNYKMSSSLAWVPGVGTAGPEEKAIFVVANLLDDVGFIRQVHGANGFLAK